MTTKSYVPVRVPPACAMSSPETTIDAACPVNVIDLVVNTVPLNETVIVVATGLFALAVPCFTWRTPPTPVLAANET